MVTVRAWTHVPPRGQSNCRGAAQPRRPLPLFKGTLPVAAAAAEVNSQCVLLHKILSTRQESQADQATAIHALQQLVLYRLPPSPCRAPDYNRAPGANCLADANSKAPWPQFFDLSVCDSIHDLSQCDLEACYAEFAQPWCRGSAQDDALRPDGTELNQPAQASPGKADRLRRMTQYYPLDDDAASEFGDADSISTTDSSHGAPIKTKACDVVPKAVRSTSCIDAPKSQSTSATVPAPKPWGNMSVKERLRCFRREADALADRALDLVRADDCFSDSLSINSTAAECGNFASCLREDVSVLSLSLSDRDDESDFRENHTSELAVMIDVESWSDEEETGCLVNGQGMKLAHEAHASVHAAKAETILAPSRPEAVPAASTCATWMSKSTILSTDNPAPEDEFGRRDGAVLRSRWGPTRGHASQRGQSRGAVELAQKLDKRLSIVEAGSSSIRSPPSSEGGFRHRLPASNSCRSRSLSGSRCSDELAQKLNKRLSIVEAC